MSSSKTKRKTRSNAEELEQKLKREAILEEQRRLEQERIRLENLIADGQKREDEDLLNQKIRQKQLKQSSEIIVELVNYNISLINDEIKNNEWQLYVDCGDLPISSKSSEMNTYLHIWDLTILETSIQEASRRTMDVIKLLTDLDDLIKITPTERLVHLLNWKAVSGINKIQASFRNHQAESLNVATYRLLRNVKQNFDEIDISTFEYNFKDGIISLSLWAKNVMPIPLPNIRATHSSKTRLELNFENLKMVVLFPMTIEFEKMAIRAMHTHYDHLSDSCSLYLDPPVPKQLDIDLYDVVAQEFITRMQYKFENRIKKIERIKIIKETEEVNDVFEEKEVLEELGSFEGIPLVPYQILEITDWDYILNIEDGMYKKISKEFLIEVNETDINLRKFTVLGGTYFLNLIEQPPQPQEFITIEMSITNCTMKLPMELSYSNFYVSYTPPPAPEAGVIRQPEEIEEELKIQERELDKLMLINLSWPEGVIFLELPLVCHWDENRRMWTKKDIHDLKHNEEKATLTFRTGRFGIFALAACRYANLPYQAWDLKPESNGSITLQISTAILLVEFNIKDGLICVTQLQNSPNMVLQNRLNEYMKFHQCKNMLQNSGVDVFPAFDAFCYLQSGTCEKFWPLEKHVYYNMALIGCCFNMSWSRWNMTAGRRKIVFQIREYHAERSRQNGHLMVLLTPGKSSFIECSDVSQVFCENEVGANNQFTVDLYHLMRSNSGITVRKKLENASKKNVYVLAQLLLSTRVLSLS